MTQSLALQCDTADVRTAIDDAMYRLSPWGRDWLADRISRLPDMGGEFADDVSDKMTLRLRAVPSPALREIMALARYSL